MHDCLRIALTPWTKKEGKSGMSGFQPCILDAEERLHTLVRIEAGRRHGHHLHLADGEADEETLQAPLLHDQTHGLGDPKPVPIAHSAPDLHPAPDYLERVCCCLGVVAGFAFGE